MKKPSEKVVRIRTTPNSKINNFWRVCPRLLEFLPEEHCSMGKPEYNTRNKVKSEGECPWWINSPEHNFCFWKYVHANSAPDGSMPELVQSKLANMLGCSNTKAHIMLKEAQEQLIEALHKTGGIQLIEDLRSSSEDDNSADPFYTQNNED